jgi:hypothetical protein
VRRDQLIELPDFQYWFGRGDVICNHDARLVGDCTSPGQL